MAADLISGLILKIGADASSMVSELQKGNQSLNSFKQMAGTVGKALAGAFTVTAIIGAGKAVFDFATEIDDLIGKVDDMGASMNAVGDAAKVKAIADTFGVEVDKVITAAASSSKQFGITFEDALGKIQKGLALAGPESQKYLKSLESQAGAYAGAGGSADDYFTLVTNGYRTGAEWEKAVKDGLKDQSTNWNDLTNEMNDGQRIQQDLIDASTRLNTIWTTTFDGTGDLVDSLTIDFKNLVADGIEWSVDAVKDLKKWFVDLYNSSALFRGVIANAVLQFKNMWEVVKLIVNNLVTGFSGAGKLITALFKGNFSEIPGIYADTMKELGTNTLTAAQNIGNNFVDGFNEVVNGKIEVMSETDAVDEGKKIARNISRGFQEFGFDSSKLLKMGDSPKELTPLSSTDTGLPATTVPAPDLSGMVKAVELQGVIIAQKERDAAITEELNARQAAYVANMQSAFMSVSSAVESAGGAFTDMARAALNAIAQIIKGLIAEGIAGAVAKSLASAPFPIGLILAGAAGAAAGALLNRLIPKFAIGSGAGGVKSSLYMAGERGPELIAGSSNDRVFSASQTQRMLNNASSTSGGSLSTSVSGEHLLFVLNNTLTARGKATL